MTRRLAAVVAVLLLLGACTSDDTPDPAPDGPTPTPLTAEEANRPGIEITYPEEDGDPLPAGEVIVAVTVRSFDVVDKIGRAKKEGEGHVHYYIDVDEIPTEEGEPAVTDDKRTYHAAAATSHRWPDVEPGTHTFAVQLVNNDHTPLDPPVTDEIRVRVGD